MALSNDREDNGSISSSSKKNDENYLFQNFQIRKTRDDEFVEQFEKRFGDGARRDRRNKRLLSILGQFPCWIAVVSFSWIFLPSLSSLSFLLLSKDIRTSSSYAALTGLDSVVIGGLSITLGTLVSTVVSVLRQRQQDIRRCLQEEAAMLESMAQQFVKLFRRDKSRLRRSIDALSRYIAEKRMAIKVSTIYGCDGVPEYWREHWMVQQETTIEMLDILAECGDNILAGPLYSFSPVSSSDTLVNLESKLMSLNSARAERRSALESTFPSGLYLTMIGLMIAIVFCFLLRADAITSVDVISSVASSLLGNSNGESSPLRLFLSQTPVRLLFIFMTSSFFSLLQIIIDLQDPFDGGAFKIDTSVIDLAEARTAGALALAKSKEGFEGTLEDQSIRPDMRADDNLKPDVL